MRVAKSDTPFPYAGVPLLKLLLTANGTVTPPLSTMYTLHTLLDTAAAVVLFFVRHYDSIDDDDDDSGIGRPEFQRLTIGVARGWRGCRCIPQGDGKKFFSRPVLLK